MTQTFIYACCSILKKTWMVGIVWKTEAVVASIMAIAIIDTFLHFIDEQGFLLGWFLLVIMLDHLTGVDNADRIGEKINSRGLRRTGLKLFVYLMNIYMIAALPYMFHGSVVEFIAEWGAKAVLLWHSFTEVASIAENTGNTTLFKSIMRGFKVIGAHMANQNKIDNGDPPVK